MTTVATASREPAGPAPAGAAPTPTTHQDWVRRAREVRERLEIDAATRDKARRPPHAEVALLRDAGLLTLLGPAEHGGGGKEWPTAYRVVREVAAADGSIGQLLGDHYTWCWFPRVIGTPEQAARMEAAQAGSRSFLACALNPRDADVVVRDHGDHVVFDGRKNFATGVPVSDVTMLEGVLEGTDVHVAAPVPTDQPGIRPHGDWDNMGQRLTESGAVTIDGVRASWDDALGFVDKTFRPRVYNSMNVPIGQLAFANFWCGIARGALDRAARFACAEGGSWGGYARSVDEPRVLDIVGDLTAKVWSAEALLDEVADEALALHRDPDEVTERARGEHKIRTAAVKSHVDSVVLETTSRIFEVTGLESTADHYGFDRFWRNARTHTLHHPVAYQRQEIGAFVLRGEVPTPGKYS